MNRSIFDEILQLYGNRASDALGSLLNNERFIASVQKLLVASLETRDFLQKSISAALEQLNIPTREDIARLNDGQRALEDRLYALEEGLERIETKLDQKRSAPAKKRVQKKTTSEEKA